MDDLVNKICAGFVTYNAEILRFIEALEAIEPQVDRVYIFDNGSTNINDIISRVKNKKNVVVIANRSNVGIATALNTLCKKAIEDNYDWLLTLDHDTICARRMLDDMVGLVGIVDAGIICPRVHYINLTVREHGDVRDPGSGYMRSYGWTYTGISE